MKQSINNRVGEKSKNKQGLEMKIIEYTNNQNILVEFEDGFKKTCQYNNFKNGKVINPYNKDIYGIAYLGDGRHKSREGGKVINKYYNWIDMLNRCYNKKYTVKHSSYEDKTVCDEWLNYQNFGEWYENNYYVIDNEKMQLDKDILKKGNKIYSPTNCIFVPDRINTLFTKSEKTRGKYPLGVHYHQINEKFQANCSIYDKSVKKSKKVYLGSYLTPEEAFYKGYKPFKEKIIKETAKEYKDYIPKILYEAMMSYVVEITD